MQEKKQKCFETGKFILFVIWNVILFHSYACRSLPHSHSRQIWRFLINLTIFVLQKDYLDNLTILVLKQRTKIFEIICTKFGGDTIDVKGGPFKSLNLKMQEKKQKCFETGKFILFVIWNVISFHSYDWRSLPHSYSRQIWRFLINLTIFVLPKDYVDNLTILVLKQRTRIFVIVCTKFRGDTVYVKGEPFKSLNLKIQEKKQKRFETGKFIYLLQFEMLYYFILMPAAACLIQT